MVEGSLGQKEWFCDNWDARVWSGRVSQVSFALADAQTRCSDGSLECHNVGALQRARVGPVYSSSGPFGTVRSSRWLLAFAASAFLVQPLPVKVHYDSCSRSCENQQSSPLPVTTVVSGFLVGKDLADRVLRVQQGGQGLCPLCFLSSLHSSRRAFAWKAESV